MIEDKVFVLDELKKAEQVCDRLEKKWDSSVEDMNKIINEFKEDNLKPLCDKHDVELGRVSYERYALKIQVFTNTLSYGFVKELTALLGEEFELDYSLSGYFIFIYREQD